MSTEALSRKEEFDKHHSFIKKHMDSALEVGKSLAYIRDEKLYLTGGFGTFEAYCNAEFNFSGRKGYRFIQAVEVTERHKLPNEYTARKLLEVPEDKRDEVAVEAKAIAKRRGNAITGTIIEEAASNVGVKNESDSEIEQPMVSRMNQLLTQVREVGIGLNEVKDEEGRFVDMSACKSAIENLISQIQTSIPTHKCFQCSGHGCESCKLLGWMPEYIFKTREQAYRRLPG
jgi:hypothetical protein